MIDDERVNRAGFFILKKLNRAIYRYDMLHDGDRIAVALSGGKDSFALLKLLQYRKRSAPERYEVCAIHVVGDARGTEVPSYPQLEDWLCANDVEYLIRPTYMADDEVLPMSCARCTRNRRKTLFEMANELGCRNVAFGHHLDDMAETVLMNLARHGKCEAMPPVREYFDGRFGIIRPMIFVPESEIIRYARLNDFPNPPSPCPISTRTERSRMKSIIEDLQKDHRSIRENLVKAALGEL